MLVKIVFHCNSLVQMFQKWWPCLNSVHAFYIYIAMHWHRLKISQSMHFIFTLQYILYLHWHRLKISSQPIISEAPWKLATLRVKLIHGFSTLQNHFRVWREFSIPEIPVRISFIFIVLVSKPLTAEQNSPSRLETRDWKRNSCSHLKARDWKKNFWFPSRKLKKGSPLLSL